MAVPGPDQHQRPGDRHRRRHAQGPDLHDVRRHRLGRHLEDGERGHDLGTGLRGGRDRVHRRYRPGAFRPERGLGRHGRSQHLPEQPGRLRDLQVRGRRKNLGPSGAGRHEHDRPDRRPSRGSDLVYVAASGHEWTANDERGVYKTADGGGTWARVLSVDASDGGHRPRHGPAESRRPLRGDVAEDAEEMERPPRRTGATGSGSLENDGRPGRPGRR